MTTSLEVIDESSLGESLSSSNRSPSYLDIAIGTTILTGEEKMAAWNLAEMVVDLWNQTGMHPVSFLVPQDNYIHAHATDYLPLVITGQDLPQ